MASQDKSGQKKKRRVGKRIQYDENAVRQAVLNVKTGRQSIYRASKSFGIPESTIRFRLNSKWSKKTRKGPATVPSKDEEDTHIVWLEEQQQRGISVVKETLNSKTTFRPNPFRKNVP